MLEYPCKRQPLMTEAVAFGARLKAKRRRRWTRRWLSGGMERRLFSATTMLARLARHLALMSVLSVVIASMTAHAHDWWALRRAQECLALSEAAATAGDLDTSRHHYRDALFRLEWSSVSHGSAQSGSAAFSRLLRLPTIALLGGGSWDAVKHRLRDIAATLRAKTLENAKSPRDSSL